MLNLVPEKSNTKIPKLCLTMLYMEMYTTFRLIENRIIDEILSDKSVNFKR